MLSKKTISNLHLESFTRQISVLLESGINLEKTLDIVKHQYPPSVSSIILKVKKSVQEGHSFAKSLSGFPSDFPEVYRGMVFAGETSGHLADVLKKLVVFLEMRNSLKKNILTALAYPMIVSFVSLLVIILLMTYVVPQITNTLLLQNIKLPMLTILLLKTSSFLTSWGPIILFSLSLSFLFFIFLYFRNEKIRYHIDKFLLTIPVIGKMIITAESAIFASTLQISISGGLDILKALQISVRVTKNRFLRKNIREIISWVREGADLGRSLTKSNIFSPLLSQMVAVGEQSGELAKMLDVSAVQLNSQFKDKSVALTIFLEPLLILIMGIFVLLIVLAVMMPLIEMNSII